MTGRPIVKTERGRGREREKEKETDRPGGGGGGGVCMSQRKEMVWRTQVLLISNDRDVGKEL